MPLLISRTIDIQESELSEEFIRASGPGGQNVNKVSTAALVSCSSNSGHAGDQLRYGSCVPTAALCAPVNCLALSVAIERD
jgi:hypothetical protein